MQCPAHSLIHSTDTVVHVHARYYASFLEKPNISQIMAQLDVNLQLDQFYEDKLRTEMAGCNGET